jgi:hypothetical protein
MASTANGLSFSAQAKSPDSPSYRAFLRLQQIDANEQVIDSLAAAGLLSASDIAAYPLHQFVTAHAGVFGGDTERAEGAHRRATEIARHSIHLALNIKELLADPHTKNARFSNATPQLRAAAESIPSYEALFGSLDYFRRPEDQSIIGPPAYLVDLLRVVDGYVTGAQSKPIPSGRSLRERRGDIYSLPLTPEQTEGTHPTVQLICSLLETALPTFDAFRHPRRVQEGVSAEQHCAIAAYPLSVPFNRPLADIRRSMLTQNVRLADLFEVMQCAASDISRERLGLSPETYAIVTTLHADKDSLNPLYGYPKDADLTTILADAGTFAQATGLASGDVTALIWQSLSQDERAHKGLDSLFINSTNESSGIDIVADMSDPASPKRTLVNLTLKRLDRIVRMIRLGKAAGWLACDTDWALRCIGASDLNADAVTALGHIEALRVITGLPLAQACGLFASLRSSGKGEGLVPADPFDTIFNTPASLQGAAPFDPAQGLIWTIAATDAVNSQIRGRLASALSVSNNELTLIATHVASSQTPAPQSGTLKLDAPTFGALYRFATLAHITKSDVTGAIAWDTLLGGWGTKPGDVLARVRLLVDSLQWAAPGPVSGSDAVYIVNGLADANVALPYDPTRARSDMQSLIAASSQSAPRFAAATFAVSGIPQQKAAQVLDGWQASGFITTDGIAGAQSPQWREASSYFQIEPRAFVSSLVDQNEAAAAFQALVLHQILVPTPVISQSALLNAGFTGVAQLSFLFPDVTDPKLRQAKQNQIAAVLLATQANITALLLAYSTQRAAQVTVVSRALASYFGSDSRMTSAMIDTLGSAIDPGYIAAFLTVPPSGDPLTEILTFLGVIARILVLATDVSLTPADVSAIASSPASFGATSLAALSLAALRGIIDYKNLSRALGCPPDSLRTFLAQSNGPGERSEKLQALHILTGWDSDQLTTLAELYWPSSHDYGTVHGIIRLKTAFNLAGRLQQDVRGLQALAALSTLQLLKGGVFDATAWATYQAAAANVINSISVGSTSDGASPSAAALSFAALRDALLPVVLDAVRATNTDIASVDDLSRFFLTDLLMGPLDVSSPVAQAILSVQLYLRRCRMNQEIGTVVKGVPDVWWEWLETFRIWQANRKVFLYPENYIDPTLRQSSTTLFNDLQQRLLQNAVTDEAVTDAYRQYLDSFGTLGQLRIVATYRCNVQSPTFVGNGIVDTIFFFARTATTPYTYYFRKVENPVVNAKDGTTSGTWSPWQQVDVSINSPFVCPVYAFGRLMLFWAEASSAKTTSMTNGTQNDSSTDSASIKYSFVDVKGHWSSPQLLLSEPAIRTTPNDYVAKIKVTSDMPLDPTASDPTQPYWQRVYVLAVPPNAFTSTSQTPPFQNAPQLLVAYGYAVGYANKAAIPQPATPTDQTDLNLSWFDTMRLANAFASTRSDSGMIVRVSPVSISNFFLQQRFDNRLTFLDRAPSGKAAVQFIGAGFDQIGVSIGNLANLYAVDYFADVIISGTADRVRVKTQAHVARRALSDSVPGAPGAPADSGYVLTNFARTNVAMYALRNDPASFVLDNGDDVLLGIPAVTPPKRVTDLVGFGIERVTLPPSAAAHGEGANQNSAPSKEIEVYYAYPTTSQYGENLPNPFQYALIRLGTNTGNTLTQRLLLQGLDSLLSTDAQRSAELPISRFYPDKKTKPPTFASVPSDTLDMNGPNKPYFWEVFFHSPFLIGNQLRGAQQYSQAKRWFEYIFNPMTTDTSTADAYWRFLPFRGVTWESLIAALTDPAAISAYENHPLDPHAIAAVRLSAYPKTIVMQYVGTLLDWADNLFTQDTRETIAEATNLYMLAADLLGPRPRARGIAPAPAPKSYNDIVALYGAKGTAKATTTTTVTLDPATAKAQDHYYDGCSIVLTSGATVVTNTIASYDGKTAIATLFTPWTPGSATWTYQLSSIPQFLIDLETTAGTTGSPTGDAPLLTVNAYFGIPENAQLIAYWDRIEDRLTKIRSSLTIAGVRQSLALFAPPVDVMALVRAAAAGGDIAQAAQSSQPQLLPFRSRALIEHARRVVSTLIEFGNSLLSILERADAEALAVIELTQGRAILNLQTQLRTLAIAENDSTALSLQRSRDTAAARQTYYANLAAENRSAQEILALDAMITSIALTNAANIAHTASSIAYTIPQLGSPFAITFGGIQVGSMFAGVGALFQAAAGVMDEVSQSSSQNASYNRRQADWSFQADQAAKDIVLIDAQAAACDARGQALQQELAVHLKQIAFNDELLTFYRQRFTNTQLYQWLSGRLSTAYYQLYQLAYDLALRAQFAFQYDFDTTTTFLDAITWQDARKGLSAGESLALAIEQMDSAALSLSERRLEIRKTISLVQLDPKALFDLRERGECTFTLSQELYDRDYPGHYARKIKTIAISLPALLGPYDTVKATLTQLSNDIVLKWNVDAARYLWGTPNVPTPAADTLRRNWRVSQGIALSGAVDDAGVFTLNHDDERYLPFEGTGAVSTWTLSMPKAANRIDYSTISDVIISVEYSALDAGASAKSALTSQPLLQKYAGGVCFALAQQFSDAWFRFATDHPAPKPDTQTLAFTIPASAVPLNVASAKIASVYMRFELADDSARVASKDVYLHLALPPKYTNIDSTVDENCAWQKSVDVALSDVIGEWHIVFDLNKLPTDLKDGDGFVNTTLLTNIGLNISLTGDLTW